MSSRKSQSETERERANRILEKQLQARDPGASKIKGYDWSKHATRSKQIQKSRQKPLFVELYDVLPRRWKGALAGIAVGLIPLIAGFIFLTGPWQVLGLLALMICAIVGFVIGKVTGNEMKQW